jgi:hypothetical protein
MMTRGMSVRAMRAEWKSIFIEHPRGSTFIEEGRTRFVELSSFDSVCIRFDSIRFVERGKDDATCYLLSATCYLLLTTYYFLLTTYYSTDVERMMPLASQKARLNPQS